MTDHLWSTRRGARLPGWRSSRASDFRFRRTWTACTRRSGPACASSSPTRAPATACRASGPQRALGGGADDRAKRHRCARRGGPGRASPRLRHVCPCPSRSCASWASRSFTQDMRDRGLVPAAGCLPSRSAPPTAPSPAAAGRGSASRWSGSRACGSAAASPWRSRRSGSRAALVPGLAPSDLDGSLYELLARRYQLAPGSARRDDRAGAARPGHPPSPGHPGPPGVPPAADDRRRHAGPRDDGRGLHLPGRPVPAERGHAGRRGARAPGRRAVGVTRGAGGGRRPVGHPGAPFVEGPRCVEVAGVSQLGGRHGRAVASAIAEGWRELGRRPVDRAVLGLTTAPADEPSRASGCARRVDRASDARRGLARGRCGDRPRRRAVAGLGRERHGRHRRGVPGRAAGGAPRVSAATASCSATRAAPSGSGARGSGRHSGPLTGAGQRPRSLVEPRLGGSTV